MLIGHVYDEEEEEEEDLLMLLLSISEQSNASMDVLRLV